MLAPAPAHASTAGRDGWRAVALGPSPLGVDIERASPAPPLPLDLLPPDARADVMALAPLERAAAFSRLWTAAEAHAKAANAPLDDTLLQAVAGRVEHRVAGAYVVGVYQDGEAEAPPPRPSPSEQG